MAAVLLLNMAQNNTTNATDNCADDVKPTIFHDFLGRGCAPAAKSLAAAGGDVTGGSPSASASGGGGGGGGRGPISTTSDLGSDRQVGTHFEGVPFYGQRSEFSGSEIGNRYSGSKRSNSDSVFMGSSREGIHQMRPDFTDGSHLMKMLRSVGAERPRRHHEDEVLMGAHHMRPSSATLMAQPAQGSKTDANASKWERAIPVNVGPVLQYPPRAGQAVPYGGYQALSNRFKEANVGPPVISQSAADEGSRTGIKGSGILSSVNVSGGVAEPSTGKQKSAISIPEPGSSTPLRRQGSTSASRQMTIFYGGQAHVFDDVHPNKADVIMALAGSNGGSWSTSYSPSSSVKPSGGETILVSGENDTGMASNSGLPVRDIRGRLYGTGNSGHGLVSNDRMSLHTGAQANVLMKDARGPIPTTAEPGTEEKR